MCPVADESLTPATLNPGLLRSLAITCIVAALGYLVAVVWAGHEGMAAALRRAGAATLLMLLALSLVNYLLRFGRWHAYLRLLGASLPLLADLRVYIAGFALTTTPGKVGELVRTVWLQPHGVPTSVSVAAFIAERFLDLLAVLLLACLGLSLHPGGRLLIVAGAACIAIALAALHWPAVSARMLDFLRARGGRLAALGARLRSVLESARACLTLPRLAAGLAVGLVAWGAEALAFGLLLQALGHAVTLPTAISIYGFSMLAGAISSTPGGLGGSEATMVALLSLCGVDLPAAVSATVLIRLATLWFAVLLGVLALALRDRAPRAAGALT